SVVLEGLAGLKLHHGNMLVRGSVKDDLRVETFQELAHACLVENVADKRESDASKTTLDEFLLDLEHLDLRLIHEEETLGIVGGNLPAELASDTAARPGDHHDSIFQKVANTLCFQLDRFA